MKLNKFELENIRKLSINVRQIKKTTEIFKLAINQLEIKAKEEYFITLDINNITLLFCFFNVYIQVSIFVLAKMILLLLSKPLQKIPIIFWYCDKYTNETWPKDMIFTIPKSQLLKKLMTVRFKKSLIISVKKYLLIHFFSYTTANKDQEKTKTGFGILLMTYFK